MSSSENYLNSFKYADNDQFKKEDIILKPCRVCGRTFNLQSLDRHVKICEKAKKVISRNVFNSFSQRAKDLGATAVVNDIKEEKKRKCKKEKEEHQENNLHTTTGGRCSNSNIMNNGLSQHKKIPAGYQQCPSCNRYFNEKAAERHIAWCTEQQTRLPKTPPNSEALERLKARIKYKAPLPKKKLNDDSNTRLVKSADSIRESSLMRTHSSPQIPIHGLRTSKSRVDTHFNDPNIKPDSPQKVNKSTPMCSKNKNNHGQDSNVSPETQNKKAVKFKEIFPVYKKERNKNLDMLAALRIRLSQLETSDDLLDDCCMKSNENELFHNRSKSCNFSTTPLSRELWSSDCEGNCKTTSNSEDSLPPVNDAGILEQRMPRFCYNCGTKYPVVSAKFCCECGARRFILGVNNGPSETQSFRKSILKKQPLFTILHLEHLQ